MPRKNYKARIDNGLLELRKFEQSQYEDGDRLFDQESDATSVGEIFQIVSDTVSSYRNDHPTRKLFRESNLNVFDPYDWGYLLNLFAEVHYENRAQGRPKVQVAAFRRKLRRHIGQLLTSRTRKPNDHQLATLFLDRFAKKYPNIKTVSGVSSLFRRHEIRVDDFFSKRPVGRRTLP